MSEILRKNIFFYTLIICLFRYFQIHLIVFSLDIHYKRTFCVIFNLSLEFVLLGLKQILNLPAETLSTCTFMHLADAFIQSDLQCIQAIHFLSVHVFPGNRTHNLCAANAMLYH